MKIRKELLGLRRGGDKKQYGVNMIIMDYIFEMGKEAFFS